jgi:NAD(P)-dependent dehydrogenase (short-subunit alcohol dehydrogenase family)
MPHAVVTGASQGLGRALLDAFLEQGWQVSFCARRADRVAAICAELAAAGHAERVLGIAADITQPADVERFTAALTQRFGAVTTWINNAGYARGGSRFCDLPAEEFSRMLETNLAGTAAASRAVLALLRAQRSGALYNVVGAGADGAYVPGMVGYGATKVALQYLTDGLAREHEGTGVIVGSISPGLVLTEAVTRNMALIPPAQRAPRIAYMNIIAELPITSARWIVAETTRNRRNGLRLNWLTKRKLLWRKLTARIAPRDVVAQSGVG